MAAVNVDAERKISQLNEEMQELVRGIKNRVSEYFVTPFQEPNVLAS